MRHLWIVLLSAGLLAALAAGADEELIWRDGQWVRQAKPAKGTAAGEVALLRQQMDRKKYGSVVRGAKRFLKRYRDERLREAALALAGDAELQRGRYWQAYGWYEKQLKEFPGGEAVDRALEREVEIGQAFLSGKKRHLWILRLPAEGDGIEILQRIAEFSPGTPRAELALLTIADHYFDKRKWADAAGAYDSFLALHADSPRAGQAELRLAEALWASYRGAMWDETPLVEAEQRYKAFALQRPAAARRARVEEILAEIHSARAEAQYEVARFYARTRAAGAAAYYYRLVMRDYGDTDWAGRAQAALGKLKVAGEPAPAAQPADAAAPAPPAPEEPKE